MPANATDAQGKKLWDFKDEGFDGFGKLIDFKDEYYIYLENRQKVIHKVIPVTDLPKIQKVKIGDKVMTIGGRDIYELYRTKISIAMLLDRQFYTTEEEARLLKKMAELRQAELAENRRLRQEELEAKDKARAQRIATILSREKITGYTETGKARYGAPVLEDEWIILKDNTAVVVVDSLEEKNPIEAFFVKKNIGGRTSKGSPVRVSAKQPAANKVEIPTIEAKALIQVIIGDQVRQILNFSKENFNHLRATGLNSGTLVAVGEPINGKYTIVQMKGNECLTVGEFAAI